MSNFTKLIAVIFLLLILMGCSKLTQGNYNKVKVGMGYQQVVEVLGDPSECSTAVGIKYCVWGSPKKNITVKFIADKVILPTMKGL